MMPRVLVFFFISIFVLSCKAPEARRPISESSGSFINQSVARNKALYEKEKSEIISLIGNDSTYINSNNGFWYKKNTVSNDIDAKTPNFGEIVNFNYSVSDLKGNLIYSKNDTKTQNYAMDREELFKGLREGLKLMKTGETATFIFPSQKAYGYYGDENKIGTNIPIICNVTVNSITKK